MQKKFVILKLSFEKKGQFRIHVVTDISQRRVGVCLNFYFRKTLAKYEKNVYIFNCKSLSFIMFLNYN